MPQQRLIVTIGYDNYSGNDRDIVDLLRISQRLQKVERHYPHPYRLAGDGGKPVASVILDTFEQEAVDTQPAPNLVPKTDVEPF